MPLVGIYESRRAASASAGMLHYLSGVGCGEYGYVTQQIDTFFSPFAFLPSIVFFFCWCIFSHIFRDLIGFLYMAIFLLHVFLTIDFKNASRKYMSSHFLALDPFCGHANSKTCESLTAESSLPSLNEPRHENRKRVVITYNLQLNCYEQK